MSIASEDKKTVALGAFGDVRPAVRRDGKENSPRRLVAHTWVLTGRLLRRWSRDLHTVAESLVVPVVLLVTLNIVLGDGISQLTGHSPLHGSVPLIAMVGAMSGSMVGGIGLSNISLAHLRRALDQTEIVCVQNLFNLADQAVIIAHSAYARTESRGAHAREDYHQRDDEHWLKHTCAWKDEDWNVRFAYRPVHLRALSNEAPSFPPAERTH